MITLTDLSVTRQTRQHLKAISLTVTKGEFVGLIGPNGAGKSTLLRAALGLEPHSGHSSITHLPPKSRADLVAFLPQDRHVAWPITIADLVALGRPPHRAQPSQAQITALLQRLDLTDFATRSAHSLSGGELARALIARLLAQDTPFVLADEPIAALDPEHQLRVMALFRDLAQEGRGLLTSLHDLTLAARFCTRLILIDQGEIRADGSPAQVLTPENLARTFRVKALHLEADGPLILPYTLTDTSL